MHRFEQAALTIGRAEECDLVLRDPGISRLHAEIRQEESGFYVVDLGSTNGTALNGLKVDRARLEPGDRIVIGTTEMTFERH